MMTTDTVGGVWSYALELARALAPRDVHVALATMGAPLTPDQRDEAGRIPHVELFESRYKLEWMQDPWSDVSEANRWLLDIARTVQPDLIHLNSYAHGALEWNAPVLMVGHSCVLSWHQAVRGGPAGLEWEWYRQEVTRGLRAADLVVAPTRAMLETLHELYGPLPNRRAILNGRNPSAYCPGRKEPFVLAAGRLWDESKNIATLARASARLNWPVCVAGDDRHPNGSRRVEWPGVRFLGRLPPDEMAREFARASIFAHPARYEPFGLAPLEAALSGCALVLGDIPTLREVWSDATQFVPPNDEAALAEAVQHLIADPFRLRARAAAARGRAETLTSSRMADEYMNAYRELIAQPTHRKTSPTTP